MINLTALKCFFVNARGLLSKIDILRDYADSMKLDIIGIAESFLTNDVFPAEINIEGFKIFRKDRSMVKAGKCGGVILYVRQDIVSYECGELNKLNSESVWCKIKTSINTGRENEITVGVCYKSPNADDNEMNELYKSISTASRGQVLIMGDFNFPNIDWDTLDSDAEGSKFIDLILDNYLSQHVKSPTREKNILDLVIVSNDSMINRVEVRERLGISDHNVLTWELKCDICMAKRRQPYRQFHKADYSEMREWFADIRWEDEFKGLDVEGIWQRFCKFMDLAIDKFVPLGFGKSKKYPKWMNRAAKKARKYKSKMWYRYRQSSSYNDLVEYKRAQNKAIKEYRRAKKTFERRLAKDIKKNPKSFYAYVRSKTKVKEVVGPLKNSEGKRISDVEEMSNILNQYFGSVFTEEIDDEVLPEVKLGFTEDSSHMLRDIDITTEIIYNKLKKLKLNKAPGVDKIVPRLLVENADVLCVPLKFIFEKSLESGIVPADWKKANVTAIYKKGDKCLPCNYRPVSLTSHVCKLLESIIRDNIINHVHKFKLIKESQHGFVSKKSCLTNLLEFLEFVSDYVDQGYPIDVIYLDFQKAFDKVPHKRLMKKVEAFGITGIAYKWIENWLSDRKQRVVLSGNGSEWINVKSGVPQGSVLGPILFLIYINDIDESVSSKILKFADDTKLIGVVSNKNEVDRLQNDLKNLCEWSNEWLMLFNIEKCKVMHIGYNNGNAKYEMNGMTLEEVNEERDLGVIIQSDLKCDIQCSKSVKSANRILGMIKRSFCNLDKEVVLQLYKSLVRPHLEYCVQAWRPHYQKDIDLIERVQRRATKLIPSFKGKSYEERLRCLNLTTLETRRLRGDLIEVFKILKGFDNIDSSKFFQVNNAQTRGHSLKLFKSGHRLVCKEFAFSHRIINVWNRLDEEIIACDSVNSFKSRIDKFLYGQGFT
ncbi:MAG: reverse transcriptase domain-containing protein [Nitrososphaerota archaeon]